MSKKPRDSCQLLCSHITKIYRILCLVVLVIFAFYYHGSIAKVTVLGQNPDTLYMGLLKEKGRAVL